MFEVLMVLLIVESIVVGTYIMVLSNIINEWTDDGRTYKVSLTDVVDTLIYILICFIPILNILVLYHSLETVKDNGDD